MDIGVFVIILIFGFFMVFGIMVINVYNNFIYYRERVLDKFLAVDELLKDRINYIDFMLGIIDKNKFHEESIVRNLKKLKKSIVNEEDVNSRLVLINDLSIDRAFGLCDVYNKLNSDKVFNNFRGKYDSNKDKIMYAIDIYNEEVLKYNNYKNKWFRSKIFTFFKFYSYDCYD